MKVGKFTGNIYKDDYDFSKCLECCHNLSEDDLKNKEYIGTLRMNDFVDCCCCLGCPAAKNGGMINFKGKIGSIKLTDRIEGI